MLIVLTQRRPGKHSLPKELARNRFCVVNKLGWKRLMALKYILSAFQLNEPLQIVES